MTAVRADSDGPVGKGPVERGSRGGRAAAAAHSWPDGAGRTGRAAAPLTSVPAGDSYTARHLSVLEGLEAVRKRPGMYIGSTDERGLMHCLWEIFDNSVDEALGGHCSSIDVVLHPDMSAEIRDDGRGIPVDVEPKSGLTGVELVMTRLHAGGKFGGGSYTASGGLHGVGASVVNALSARLDVEVDREGHEWAASFRRGVPGEFAAEGPQGVVQPRGGAAQDPQGGPEGDRDQDPVLARPAGVHEGRGLGLRGARGPGPADRVPRPRPGDPGPRRSAGERASGRRVPPGTRPGARGTSPDQVPLRKKKLNSGSTAESASSASTCHRARR